MYQREKRKERLILSQLTLCVMVIILFMIGIIRTDAKENKVAIPIKADYLVSSKKSGINIRESIVVGMLYEGTEFSENKQDKNDNPYLILTDNLEKYLSSSGVELTIGQTDRLIKKIKELIGIFKLEDECDFTKMSIDGRTVAIDITKQICSICGLTLNINIDGTIQYISVDGQKDKYWVNKNKQLQPTNFNIYASGITSIFILSLIGIMLYIGKKNKLFIRNVGQNEFNEKRYA